MTVEDQDRYARALHAMQSGVAAEMQHLPAPTEPKHLRVGVNSSMISDAAVVKLLIDKGVFTQDEFEAAMADSAEAEVGAYEARLSEHFGAPVHLA